jgi:hypothetical protein
MAMRSAYPASNVFLLRILPATIPTRGYSQTLACQLGPDDQVVLTRAGFSWETANDRERGRDGKVLGGRTNASTLLHPLAVEEIETKKCRMRGGCRPRINSLLVQAIT